MKKQTIILKKNVFGNGYFKATPRSLLMLSNACEYKEDKKKLENISYDLQTKYGVEDFMIKSEGNKLHFIPLNEKDEFGGVF